MANLTVTAAQVLPTDNTVQEKYIAGEAITAGQAVYFDSTTQKVKLAQADGTAAEAAFFGIALGSAPGANQPIVIARPVAGTSITIGAGAAPTVAATFALSATAGSIAASADIVTTGHFRTLIGVGGANNTLVFCTPNTATALP